MAVAGRLEHPRDGLQREVRAVAVGAQVHQEDMLQVGPRHAGHHLRRMLVGEMPQPPLDPPLELPGTLRGLEQVLVVIRLDRQHLAPAQRIHHPLGDHADVGGDADADGARLDDEPHGIGRVVRHRERFHLQVAHGERRPALEHAPSQLLRPFIPAERLARGGVDIEGNAVAPVEHPEPCRVIAMLMADADGADLRQVQAQLFQPPLGLPAAQAGIDQQPGAVGSDIRAVARTAAGQYACAK